MLKWIISFVTAFMIAIILATGIQLIINNRIDKKVDNIVREAYKDAPKGNMRLTGEIFYDGFTDYSFSHEGVDGHSWYERMRLIEGDSTFIYLISPSFPDSTLIEAYKTETKRGGIK